MSLEGRVTIELGRKPYSPATIVLDQPGSIERLLTGKLAAETPMMVSSIYSVCSMAQAHASVLALEDAEGIAVDSATTTVRHCLTDMEALREGALRVGLDWPRLIGEGPEASRLRDVVQLLPRLRTALEGDDTALDVGGHARFDAKQARAIVDDADTLLADLAFGELPGAWLDRLEMEGAAPWIASRPTAAARVLAMVEAHGWREEGKTEVLMLQWPDRARLRACLDHHAGDLGSVPGSAGGRAPEATVLSANLSDPALRAAGGGTPAGLLTRMMARLIEIARLVGRMRQRLAAQSEQDQSGGAPRRETVASRDGRCGASRLGVGTVATARGTLIHAVEVEDGRIRRYRLLPPTLWNFHRDGIAARALSSVSAREESDRMRIAELLVSAIDPCVAHELRFV